MIFDPTLSLQQVQTLMQNSFDSVWILNFEDRKLKYANRVPTERLLGYPVERFYENPSFWLNIVHDDDKHIAAKLYQDSLTNKSAEATYRVIRSNGEVIRILVRQKVIADEFGVPSAIIGCTVDVTNFHNIKDQLSKSLLQFNSFFYLSLELLCIGSYEGHFKQINPAFLNCLGYSLEEILSRPFLDLIHPDDLDKTYEELEKLKGGAVTLDFENRYRCKDNTYRIISWRCVAIPEERSFYCAARDVTQERKNLEILHRSNKLLEATQSVTKVGGWEIDIHTNTLSWTRETYLIHDTTPDEYTPTLESAINFYAPESIPIISKAVAEALQHGKEFDLELELITMKKRRIAVRAVGKPHIQKGELINLSGIFLDITESKKIVQQLEEQKKSLIYSAKMSSLGEMAAAIAHEINNPLAIINGSLFILKKMLQTKQMDELLLEDQVKDMQVTSNRIVKIIQGLQLFSRNSDSDSFTSSTIDKIIEETLVFCQQRFKNNNVDLIIDLNGAKGVEFQSKSTQISQVLLNLLNNAFDATQVLKEKWIKIETKIEDNKYILIRVSDSGRGIEPNIAREMMKPFFTTKEVGKGTGLGLSISKGIVDAHGGDFFYDKDSPHTTFAFKIPLKLNSP